MRASCSPLTVTSHTKRHARARAHRRRSCSTPASALTPEPRPMPASTPRTSSDNPRMGSPRSARRCSSWLARPPGRGASRRSVRRPRTREGMRRVGAPGEGDLGRLAPCGIPGLRQSVEFRINVAGGAGGHLASRSKMSRSVAESDTGTHRAPGRYARHHLPSDGEPVALDRRTRRGTRPPAGPLRRRRPPRRCRRTRALAPYGAIHRVPGGGTSD